MGEEGEEEDLFVYAVIHLLVSVCSVPYFMSSSNTVSNLLGIALP